MNEQEKSSNVVWHHATAGEISDFTGVSSPYEEPETPELEVDTTSNLKDCSFSIFEYISTLTRT